MDQVVNLVVNLPVNQVVIQVVRIVPTYHPKNVEDEDVQEEKQKNN